jgi:hypothetical protein
MSKGKSPVPPGAMVELQVDNIDEGKFKKQFNAAMRRAFKELLAFQKESDSSGGKSVVTASITILKTPGTSDHFTIQHGCKTSVPTMKNVSIVKARGERLLCQPIGASEHDPDQQAFFDAQGRVIGGIDPDTGELIEDGPSPVAGKIAQA